MNCIHNIKSIVLAKFWIIFLLINLNSATAQNYRFNHLTTKNGLSEDIVQAIIQDKEGFIWIGTKDGLNCYNGNSFTVYRNDREKPGTISNNVIYDLLEDKDGTLWVATLNGLNKFNKATRTFYTYLHDPNNANSLVDNYISKLAEDKYGNIWTGTFDFGINVYNKKTNKFEHFSNKLEDSASISSNRILALYCDKNGDIWINAANGLNKFNYESKNFTRYYNKDLDPKVMITYNVSAIYEDSDNNLWVGLPDGLYKVDKERKIVNRYLHYTQDEAISNVMDIIEDNQNNLYIASYGGLIKLNKKGKYTIFQHKEQDPNSLSNNQVWKLFFDKKGSLWLGTFTGGVNILNFDYKAFVTYKHNPENINSISNSFVLSFIQDKDNNIWIGTDGGGLNYFDREKETFKAFKHINGDSRSIGGNSILSLALDHKGFIWAGTWDAGVSRFNPKTGISENYPPNPLIKGSLNCPHVWAILEDSKKNLWIGTMGGGLNKYNRETNTFTAYVHDPKNKNSSITFDNNVWAIYEDSHGQLWVGTSSGLCKFFPDKGQFTSYLRDDSKPGNLSLDWVLCIFEDSKKRFWIGTHGGGLNLFDRETGKFKAFGLKDGLPNDVIHGLLEDKKGFLWISTNKGLSRFDPENMKFWNFDISHGLQGNQYSLGAYLKLHDGTMLFGGPGGFDIFNPDEVKGNQYKPPIVITNLRIFNKLVEISENSVLKKDISQLEEITLEHYHSVFTLEFAALNYINPEKNRYKYILKGFDKEWNDVGTKYEATYTNLDPGEYTFTVIGSNNDGVWNTEGRSLKITINPPFYETWYFRVILVLTILLIMALFYYKRTRYIRKKNEELSRLVEERTHEITEKNRILTEQSEELFSTNQSLAERQQKIEEQAEELQTQTEELLTQSEELMKQRDILSQLNTTKDKLFSILAHDLKTPFNSLIGFSELLYNNVERYTPERIKMQVQTIRDAARFTYDLLENLLQWSRAQRGVIEFTPENIDLIELAERELRILRQQGLRKEVEVKLIIKGQSKPIYCDSNMIQTVLRNLVSNAIKYSFKGGEVNIIFNYNNDKFICEVKDNGIGFGENVKEKLFKISEHISNPGTVGEKGTGLGLILCYDFITRHNGIITATSTPEMGSTFSFSIPLTDNMQ